MNRRERFKRWRGRSRAHTDALRQAENEIGWCHGDVGSHWSGFDYRMCSYPACDGEDCIVAARKHEIYKDLLIKRDLT